MKKLIAFVSCVIVMTVMAYAERPAKKANLEAQVTAQITNGLRVVDVTVYPAEDSADKTTGKAVIISFNQDKSKVDLLLDVNLTRAVDLADDEGTGPVLGKIVNGMIKVADASILKNIRSVQIQHRNRPEHVYRVTLAVGKLTGNNAHNAQLMQPISEQKAIELLK